MQALAQTPCTGRVGPTRSRQARSTPLRSPIVAAAVPARAQQPEEVVEIVLPSAARRAVLLAGASALLAQLPLATPAFAYQQSTLCADTDDEAADSECRRAVLSKDASKQENYGQVSQRKFELAPNVPVSVLDDVYTKETLALMEKIEAYCNIDLYDKARIGLVKTIKAEGTNWVSKYARGGSARTQSARRMYIAVDAVVGHLASNGYAPLPNPKIKAVLKSVDEARDFLSKNL